MALLGTYTPSIQQVSIHSNRELSLGGECWQSCQQSLAEKRGVISSLSKLVEKRQVCLQACSALSMAAKMLARLQGALMSRVSALPASWLCRPDRCFSHP